MVGIATVILVHVVVIYAMMTGLVRTAVEVIKKPLTATIVKELPPPPPPPPRKIEVPRPPPAYVPPADIPMPVQAEATGPTITAVTAAPPVAAPPAPPPVVAAPAPPPPPPKPAVRRGIKPIARENPVFPRAAIRLGIDKGRVIAHMMVDEKGNVTNVVIVSAEPARHFDKAVIDALTEWKFTAEGEKYVVEVEINFSLKD